MHVYVCCWGCCLGEMFFESVVLVLVGVRRGRGVQLGACVVVVLGNSGHVVGDGNEGFGCGVFDFACLPFREGVVDEGVSWLWVVVGGCVVRAGFVGLLAPGVAFWTAVCCFWWPGGIAWNVVTILLVRVVDE